MARLKKHHAVDMVRDDPVLLRDKLDEIAEGGGRIINVIWQPARRVTLGDAETNPPSGYIVISEYEFPDAPKP